MDHTTILLDTCVVSQGSRRIPAPGYREWMARHPNLAISFPSFVEIQMGILKMPDGKKEKAELAAWFSELRQQKFAMPDMTLEAADILAEMLRCGALTHLWLSNENKPEIQGKFDLHIAAIAIAHNMPLATYDGDFEAIRKHFPQLRLINPTARNHRSWPYVQRGPLVLGKRAAEMFPPRPHHIALGRSLGSDTRPGHMSRVEPREDCDLQKNDDAVDVAREDCREASPLSAMRKRNDLSDGSATERYARALIGKIC